jgi:hypothetical protein
MEVSGQLHVPAALTSGKELQCPLDSRPVGPQSSPRHGGEEKNSQAGAGTSQYYNAGLRAG